MTLGPNENLKRVRAPDLAGGAKNWPFVSETETETHRRLYLSM